MRAAGLVVARTLALLGAAAKPGVSTAELDELAEQNIRDADAVPSFKGYHGFPATVLADGDLISVDCGAILDGWHGDAAVTLAIGSVSDADLALSAATKDAMWAGVKAAVPGARLTDISHAIETSAGRAGDYGQILEYGGHGIGRQMHMDPFLPNVGKPGKGPRLEVGMALAIEPMLTLGGGETKEL